jgi:predicted nucleotidyltransferase
MKLHEIEWEDDRLAAFCDRWDVIEFSLFGSILRDDFRADSDVDVLVDFAAGARRTLFDLVAMELELIELFGRDVDLLTRGGIESSSNYLRRQEILSSVRSIYESRSTVSA